MNIILYLKGKRGLAVLEGLIESRLIPNLIILEEYNHQILNLAKDNSLKTLESSDIRELSHIEIIKQQKPDIIIAAGFSKIFPKELIKIPKLATINCHGGKLPKYRGSSPIPWQIINGEKDGKCYFLKMEEGIDDGDIYYEEMYDINPDDNATSISVKVNNIFKKNISKVLINIFTGNFKLIHQPEGEPIIWTRRIPSDGFINFKMMQANEIFNLVRGLTDPYPNAFFYLSNKKILVQKVLQPSFAYRGIAGRFVGIRENYPIIIAKDKGIAITKYEILDEDKTIFPPKYGTDIN